MAELVDALASGASRGNSVQVQVLLSAPKRTDFILKSVLFLCFRNKFYLISISATLPASGVNVEKFFQRKALTFAVPSGTDAKFCT